MLKSKSGKISRKNSYAYWKKPEILRQQELIARASTGEIILKEQKELEELSAERYPEAWIENKKKKVEESAV